MLAHFNQGQYNVLVATSIAEEGLDIAEVDLIIFFDIVSSLCAWCSVWGEQAASGTGAY